MTIYVAYFVFIILLYAAVRTFDFYLKPKDVRRHMTYEMRLKKYRYDIKWFIIISISVLILIFGLRAQTMGIDLIKPTNDGYLQSFIKINSQPLSEALQTEYHFEKGFIIFNKLVGTASRNCQFFLFVCAAISLIPVGVTIYKYSPMPLTSLLIYLGLPTFVILFSTIRQGIALSITLMAFDMIKKRKKLLFVLLVLLAATFHKSAIVFLAAYPLYYMKTSNTMMALQALTLPTLWLFRVPLFRIFTKVLYGNYRIDNNGAVELFITFTLIYIFGIVYGDRNNDETNGLLNLFWAACAIQSMAGVSSVVMRMGYYFIIFLMLLLPEIFQDMKATSKPAQRKFIIAAVLICFVAFGYYQIRNTYWSESYPYVFFWDQAADLF